MIQHSFKIPIYWYIFGLYHIYIWKLKSQLIPATHLSRLLCRKLPPPHGFSGIPCYLLPSLYAASFVRRTTSSTDLHPFLKRSLYLIRFNHFVVYTGCGTFLKRVCHNTRTLLSYLHFYARTYKSIYRLINKTHPSMHIIVLKSKTLKCD